MDSAPPPAWPPLLATLLAGQDLSEDDAAWAMEQVLTGSATSAQIAGLVVGLRAKGETPAEVGALARTMLSHARLLDLDPAAGPYLDVVGTGGDQAHTVNISTMAALVCAAAGAPVVKHGNRAASSSTGTADVLEELGVVIALEPDAVATCVRDGGIGFCFAQVHHPAMRHAGPTRRELGVPTVFNILGPLTNPGGATAALIGSASPTMAPVMADVLRRRGVRALVVRGEDGLDEISTCAPTRVWDATVGDTVVEGVLDGVELGVPRIEPALLRGGDAARNAALLTSALGGQDPAGPDAERVAAIRDAVAVNAAAALAVHAAAAADLHGTPTDQRPLAQRIADQLPRARQVLADGSALQTLTTWALLTQTLASGSTR